MRALLQLKNGEKHETPIHPDGQPCCSCYCGGTFAHSASVLNSGQKITSNQYLESTNLKYRFYLQSDGNLVLRDWGHVQRSGLQAPRAKGGTRLTVQSDGNIVLYTLIKQSGLGEQHARHWSESTGPAR